MGIRKRTWKTKDGKEASGWAVEVKKRLPGKLPVRIYKQFERKSEAEAFERQILAKLASGTFDPDPVASKDLTLGQFIEEFLTNASNDNKPSTLDSKKAILRDHIEPFFGKVKLKAIHLPEIDAFKAHLKAKKSEGSRATKADASKWAVKKRTGQGAKPLSIKTINNILTVLKRVFTLAEEYRYVDAPPTIKLLKGGTEADLFFLDFAQAASLEAAADDKWRCAIALAMKSGLRQGELIGLQWSDVELGRNRLTVKRTVWKGQEGTPKGGRTRTVELPGSVVSMLEAHPRSGPYVFSKEGVRLTPGLMNVGLRRALSASGMDLGFPVGWHALRHTYASHLAMRGVPIVVIQRLMGHATIEMTMRYAHLSPETVQSAVGVLDLPVAPVGVPVSNTGPTIKRG